MRRRCLPSLLLLLLPPLAATAQLAPSPTTTTLTSSSPTLQLPGSLTFTSVVTPQSGSPGMPTGNVTFSWDGTNSLGTAPLAIKPGTENFLAPAITGTLGDEPIGIFAQQLTAGDDSVLGILDWYSGDSSTATPDPEPRLTIYSGHGTGLLQTAAAYLIANSGFDNSEYGVVDAFAVADFNHDGYPDVLLHGYTGSAWQYYLLPGTSGGGFNPAAGTVIPDVSGLICYYCNPGSVIATDDFNGDGYPDVALAGYYPGGPIGVALNAGATAPGTFPTFTAAPPVTVAGESFAPAGIASGHFTSSGHADLVVSGYFTSDDEDEEVINPGAVALYLGNGDGTFAAPVLFPVGVQPEGIATADFRNNGMTDVVVANTGSENNDASVEVLFGDGKGGLTESSTVPMVSFPESVKVADFNGDGYPDILAECTDGSLNLLLNDGTGHFSTYTLIGTAAGVRSFTAIGDFNSDTLPDIAQLTLTPPQDTTNLSSAFAYLNSATSQATLTTAPQTLPAGTHAITATYPGDVNFTTSVAQALTVTVTQTTPTVAWSPPAAIEYGTPLSAAQLDATSSVPGSFAYKPAAATVLPPGSTTVTAIFAPTDSFDYTGATTSAAIAVAAPSLTGISPSAGVLGTANTTIAVSGQGFLQGAQVAWNGTALATTWVSLNQLTAAVPASLLASIGTATVTVMDPGGVAVSGSSTFTITASPAVAQSSAPATATAGQNSSVTLTVSPYPIAITATLTLSFTPAPPNTAPDPSVLFPNNSTTETIDIPANSTTTIPPVDFSAGSTAGTITVTVTLSAGGANVTPASLVPIVVTVPPTAPTINSVTLTRSGTTLTVAVLGLSSTRDMTQAHFHFTAAPGQSLTTTDLTVPLSTAFTTWYQSEQSTSFGTAFLYTQPFTLDSDASSVGSVTVTLTNSQGDSQPGSAQ